MVGDNPAEPGLHLPYPSQSQGCEQEMKCCVFFIVRHWVRSAFLHSIVKNVDDSDKIGTVLSH